MSSSSNRIAFIPAIDLIGGNCVRLTQGDYTQQTTYSDNPVELAKRFEDAGVTRLHLVDLDGAKAGRVVNLAVLEKISAATRLQVDFGGGVKTEEDVTAVRNAGAAWVTIGSIAAKNPERVREWIGRFGASSFFLGADVRNGFLALSGWTEQTEIAAAGFINAFLQLGLTAVFCTDISKDGMLAGPALDLYGQLLAACPGVSLTASGGVRDMQDVHELETCGCSGVIVGKAIYEGRISWKEIESFHR